MNSGVQRFHYQFPNWGSHHFQIPTPKQHVTSVVKDKTLSLSPAIQAPLMTRLVFVFIFLKPCFLPRTKLKHLGCLLSLSFKEAPPVPTSSLSPFFLAHHIPASTASSSSMEPSSLLPRSLCICTSCVRNPLPWHCAGVYALVSLSSLAPSLQLISLSSFSFLTSLPTSVCAVANQHSLM